MIAAPNSQCMHVGMHMLLHLKFKQQCNFNIWFDNINRIHIHLIINIICPQNVEDTEKYIKTNMSNCTHQFIMMKC